MDRRIEDEGLIRRYLLGELTEDERQQFEKRMMIDTELDNEVLLAEDEIVERYTEGRLPEDELEHFETSFLSTADGRQQLSFARALSKYVSTAAGEESQAAGTIHRPALWRPASVGSYWKLAAAAVVVVGLALGIWRVFFYQSEVSKGIAALAYAYREQRPFEARISGLNYAPAATTRGAAEKVDRVARHRAERILLDEVFEHPSPAAHHALGQLYLAEQKFDDAIAQFEEALKAEPNNAQPHNDLGAALMEKGRVDRFGDESGTSLKELAAALEHFSEALELDGNILEALFNRALCRQYLLLPRQAEEDWKTYLEKDPNSRWADEARQHLKEIAEQEQRKSKSTEQSFQGFIEACKSRDGDLAWDSLRQAQVRAGNSIAENLVDRYLDLLAGARREEANSILDALSCAGELAYQRVGERYVLDLAKFYKFKGSNYYKELTTARNLVDLGQKHLAASSPSAALESYLGAKLLFDRVGDRCESRCVAYWIGICYSQQGNARLGLSALQEIAETCDREGYKWLVVRGFNGVANQNLILTEYTKAISAASQSQHLAERTQDTYGLVLALAHLVEGYRSLGNYDQCLNHLQQIFWLASEQRLEPTQACLHYTFAAWVLSSKDFNRSALDYQRVALELALDQKELTMTCLAYAHLGMIYGKLKDYDEAFRQMQQALEMARSRSDLTAGLLMIAYSSLRIGDLYRQKGDLAKAIESYDESIRLNDQFNYLAFVHQAHKGLFQAYDAFGEVAQAEKQLESAISYYESHRTKILEQNNRNAFFDQEQDVYDLAIGFEISRLKNAAKAFEYSEMSRGRSLLDLVQNRGQIAGANQALDVSFSAVSQPLSLGVVRNLLPDQVQLLQYAVLDDRVIFWLVTRNRFDSFERRIRSNELNEMVRDYTLLITASSSGDREEVCKAAEQLYDLLIAPAEPLLDRRKQIFVVPDKMLNELAFQSLISPVTGRYLIEDYAIAVSPSASLLIACSREASTRTNNEESLLSVALTHFDQREVGGLPDLPSAAKEARSIADCYTSRRLLVGDRAGKKTVMTEMEGASVIHIASHFILGSSPLRSRLVLAKEPRAESDGQAPNPSLEISDVYGLRLPESRLVVLSACRTGMERYYRGEGTMSIARAFTAVGVPLVVASLWAVDSDSTTELMIRFHQYRKAGGRSSAESLRLAQIEMLKSAEGRYRHPYYWASFIVIGGYATY